MWYYVKQAFLPFVYLFFMAMTALAIIVIKNELLWLKIILLVLNLGLYGFIVCATSFKDGETALKTRIANDMEREQIIITGEPRELKLKEEYKVWKGFFNGFIACVPLLFLMLLHTVLIFAFGEVYNGAGVVAGLIYLMVFAFFRLDTSVVLTAGLYYGTLVALPIIVLMTGIPYILGAKRVEYQQNMIKAKHREIYGDEN
jgi:hypothetical protein